MLQDRRVDIDPSVAGPFEVLGRTILVHPDAIDTVAGTGTTMMEALELANLCDAMPNATPAERLAHRILARVTAVPIGTPRWSLVCR
jgi:hypothetical protein